MKICIKGSIKINIKQNMKIALDDDAFINKNKQQKKRIKAINLIKVRKEMSRNVSSLKNP